MKIAKRDALAAFSRYSGFTRLLSFLPERPMLLVLNYHRIGNPEETPYDPELFSATAAGLEEQVRFLKRRFHLAPLDEALEIVEGARRPRGAVVLLTFDDGYLDNYRLAFPVLASYGAPAVFFLPTSFIGSNHISWWDSIAYIIKGSRNRKFRLGAPPFPEFDIDAMGAPRVIGRVLDIYRRGAGAAKASEPFIAMLEEACASPRPNGTDRCFMNWDEAAEMLRGGMAIGSHGHSHEILARLPDAEQRDELVRSRRILEERLGTPIRALSYPVGLPESFSSVTRAAAVQAGYRVAFSFYGRFNRPGGIDPYDVGRFAVSPHMDRFRLQTSLAAATASYWFR